MWNYEKRLQYPVHIKTPNAKIAKIILTQYGGPDGEMGASMRYLCPNRIAMGTLNDIATEELGHLEMVVYYCPSAHSEPVYGKRSKIRFCRLLMWITLWGSGPQAAGGIPF